VLVLLVLLAEARLVEFLRHAVVAAVADRPPFALTGRYIVIAGEIADIRMLSLFFFQLWVVSGKFFDVAVFCNRCSIYLCLLVGGPGLYLNRFLLSFLNEEQMPAAWLSDWDVACPETETFSSSLSIFRPEELLWAARTIRGCCCAASCLLFEFRY